MKYIEIGEPGYKNRHIIGNDKCDEGWCSTQMKRCKCGGLIHVEFGDESCDDIWFYKICDKCGEHWEEVD